ncbi:MAG: energy transducer TonB, partial [Verrucomicrobiota bacterium]
DKPEMEEPPPPMTLMQLEMALNPGSGDAVGDFGFSDFQGVDVMSDMQIFDIGDLDKNPRALFQVEPNYPYSLQQAQIEGWCTVEFVITDKGSVIRARAVRSSHREFENPAVESIMRSKWQPGKKDGKNVNVRVRQKILFTL